MPKLTVPRIAALLGVAWLILFIVGGPVLQGRPPTTDVPLATLRASFHDHGTRYLIGDFIAGCGFALLLVPFAFLFPYALTPRPHPALSRLAGAAAVSLAVAGGVATSFLDAVAIAHGSPALGDATLTALLYANAAGIALIGLPAALFTTTAAAMLWQSGLRGVAVVGAVATPLLIAGAAFPLGAAGGPLWTIRFAGFVALALFVLATSVSLLIRPQPTHEATR